MTHQDRPEASPEDATSFLVKDCVLIAIATGKQAVTEGLWKAKPVIGGDTRGIRLQVINHHNGFLINTPKGAALRIRYLWAPDARDVRLRLEDSAGEQDGYYQDYAARPAWYLGRCLTEGFAYQGEPSPYRHGECRGEPSAHLPSTAFVSFLQNHDQVGNRAFGERINALTQPQALHAALAILLLAPSPPLLFMGQEFCASSPFLFFCEFGDDLAGAVTQGRRREFARFARFADPEARESIPDPNAAATFECWKLDWEGLLEADQRTWLTLHQQLLRLRQREIVPRLRGLSGHEAGFEALGDTGLVCRWRLGDDSRLTLLANLGDSPLPLHGASYPSGTSFYAAPVELSAGLAARRLPPWAVAWFLRPGGEQP